MSQENYYFTFGCGQPHFGKYKKFRGTVDSTRQRMVLAFGQVWSMQYTEEEFLPQIEKYNLEELK